MRAFPQPIVFATALAMLSASLPAGAQTAAVTVTINGAPVTFDQPPVEQAGRVYVPLRGVFERLGASVVYDHGRINATKDPTTVSLSVGSTAALVNGQQQHLDNPPIVVGSRVLVPLRFVSQALGTTVTFIKATQTVAISVPVAGRRSMPRRPLGATPTGLLGALSPASGGPTHNVAQITAQFTQDVDPKSVRASIDGADVTPQIFITGRAFVYYVTTPLSAGEHAVSLSGKLLGGQAFHSGWSFSTP